MKQCRALPTFFLLLLLLPFFQLAAQITAAESGTTSPRFIHILVALCDNKNQGIVPVPEKIGNGQDPSNNLYWGCAYGIRTYFSKQKEWKVVKSVINPESGILERIYIRHPSANVYLVADAYDGAYIRTTITDLLMFSSGRRKFAVTVEGQPFKLGGSADLLCYIGHNGLMDFSLASVPSPADSMKRDIAILACYSKRYFAPAISITGASPILWTTHFMAPEAYTIHAAINGWIARESGDKIRERAAQAYNKYQKCGIRGARGLFVSGW